MRHPPCGMWLRRAATPSKSPCHHLVTLRRITQVTCKAGYRRRVRRLSFRPTPRVAVVAILGAAGVAHFVFPAEFDRIVPTWMPGSARTTTYASGAVELAVAVLLASRARPRFAGYLALATFVGVFPANVQSALDGGIKGAPPPLDSALAAWLRLPLQIPLLWLAWRTINDAS